MIYPSHLQIEVINGACTARCSMCTFKSWTRKPNRMSNGMFTAILLKFLPYKQGIDFLSLQGFGESLLDKELPDKVKIAKALDYKSVGFATNCTELTRSLSIKLLDAGLDTLICSIDGSTAKTHESIRVGTNFREVVENVLRFIKLRNERTKTKIILRFIRQKSNEHEWEGYKKWWEKRLDPFCGDAVTSFDIVDCDNKVEGFKEKEVHKEVGWLGYCDQLYKRMIVYSNGEVALCCADDNGKFKLGNVLEKDPILIYNSPTFIYYRRMLKEGKMSELELCNTCSIPKSQQLKGEV